jgi:RNA polymerase sigma factor (sigma-70 family)
MRQNVPQPDHKLLMAFARERSEPAFEELVRRHAQWVYAAAFRQLRDRHLAEDATQAVFLLLCRKAGRMGPDQKLSGWLFRSLQFAARTIKRGNARRRRREHFAAASPSVEVSPEQSDLAEQLDGAVAKLPSDDGAIVLLRFYQGLAFEQIADSLCISQEAARKRTSRAIERLRKILGVPVSTESLSLAVTIGSHPAPAALVHTVSRTVLSSMAGGAVPSGAGAVAKGTLHLMALAKAKIAATIVVFAILVPASASVLLLQHQTPVTQPAGGVGAGGLTRAEQDAASVRDAFYTPKSDQILLHTTPPFPPHRKEFYLSVVYGHMKRPPAGIAQDPEPRAMSLEWQSGEYVSTSWEPNRDITLSNLLRRVLDVYPQEMEGDEGLIGMNLPGDFVFQHDATQEQRRAAIEEMMGRDFHTPASLTYRDVERNVYVLRGRWTGPSLDAVSAAGKPMVSFVVPLPAQAKDANAVPPRAKSRRRGTAMEISFARGFTGWLGRYLSEQVVLEADGVPRQILWDYSDDGTDLPQAWQQGVERLAVLKRFQEQTGLSATEEKRTVPRLFVERSGL